ncbi:hypothetical protein DPMN_121210 [Dreissena polymorpha]|uniref:Uncharacterized protein n=1 Tax=Dreissena polymorpha TaxID=45954 RepID=A0A9D4GMB4_DREPO|nr:hypothetical protein DPMN_121210 [Dreissena polymorpha]
MKKTFRRNLRMASHRYDEKEMERIDTLAEIDQQAFGKVVNSNAQIANKMVVNSISMGSGRQSSIGCSEVGTPTSSAYTHSKRTPSSTLFTKNSLKVQ